MTAVAVMIDSREPDWVAKSFTGVDTAVTMLDYGDTWVACDDGHMLYVERKTPDDLLGSLKDGRLFDQVYRMTKPRLNQQLRNETPTNWAYLMITGPLLVGPTGTVHTGNRDTGWQWNSVWGALLTIQEMGCLVTFAPSDTEYAKTVMMLANRDRNDTIDIMPARMPIPLDARAHVLCGLPGIGIERAKEILEWSGGNLAHALCGLTDMNIKAPVGEVVRKKIRAFLGLGEQQTLDFVYNQTNQEVLVITTQEKEKANV